MGAFAQLPFDEAHEGIFIDCAIAKRRYQRCVGPLEHSVASLIRPHLQRKCEACFVHTS